jgi:hypothetical protein
VIVVACGCLFRRARSRHDETRAKIAGRFLADGETIGA